MKKTRVLVFIALFVSIEIVLTRLLSIETPIVRIGFGFIPIALSSIMFGPVLGGLTATLSDLLGMMMFARAGYFPGFTLSALLGGVIYGLFLYKKPNTIWRVTLAVLTISVFVDLGLNTVWISMITGKAAIALLVPRLIKTAAMLPVQVFMIHIVWKYVGSQIQSRFGNTAK